MKLTPRRNGRDLIIAVEEPRIDAAVAIQFKDTLRGLTEEARGTVILDLAKVDFIDSSGLGALVASLKQMPEGTSLELAQLNPAVAKVLALTRMDTVFKIHDSATGSAQRSAG